MKPPRYVFMLYGQNKIAMRLTREDSADYKTGKRHQVYYRDAGHWEMRFKMSKGEITAIETCSQSTHLIGCKFVKCTKAQWKKDNAGYVGGNGI